MMRNLVIGALIGFFAAVLIVAALGSRDTPAPVIDAGVASVDAGCKGCRTATLQPIRPLEPPQLRFPIARQIPIPVPPMQLADAGR